MIRSILTGYLKMSIAAILAVSIKDFSDSDQTTNSIISVVVLISLCQYPLSFGYLLHRKRESLTKEEVK